MIVLPSLHTAHEVVALAPGWGAGEVARAERVLHLVGGKPVNVARAAAAIGASVRLVALADRALTASLRADPALAGVELRLVRSPTPSRTDVAIVDRGGAVTVVNGHAEAPDPTTLRRVLAAVRRGLGRDSVLVLAGSLPGDDGPGLLRALVGLGRSAGARVLADASGAALSAALDARVDVLKVTAEELAAVRGGDANGAFADGRSLAPEPVTLVVTAGARGLRAWLPEGSVRQVTPPPVAALNTLGSGDALLAGIAAALDAGRPLPDGLVDGTALAAASAERLDLAVDGARARALRPLVRVTRLA